MSSAAQMFTLQLDSAAAQDLGNGQYRTALYPPLKVPYMAKPTAMVRDVTFTNSMLNVDSRLYKNDVVRLAWVADPSKPTEISTAELTIPSGNYNLPALEIELARQAYATAGAAYANPNTANTSAAGKLGLWAFMDSVVGFPAEALTLVLASEAAKGGNEITITSATRSIFVGMSITATGIPSNTVVKSVTGSLITLTADLTAAIPKDSTVTLAATDDSYKGYGVNSVAPPVLSASSSWGTSLLYEEMTAIARAAVAHEGVDENNVVPPLAEYVTTDGKPTFIPQGGRRVWPFYLNHDPSTNKLHMLCAAPAVKVMAGSTLVTGLLGFSVPDSTHTDPASAAFTVQDPFLSDGVPWVSTLDARIVAARSLIVHVPSLVGGTTYGRDGRMQGAQLAQVPVAAGQNEIISWQPMTPLNVPCALHGTDVTEIVWYITNERGEAVDFQKAFVSVTATLSWPDPGAPQLGSAEANMLIRDVDHAY